MIAFFTGHAAPSDNPQIVVPGNDPHRVRDFEQQVDVFQLPAAASEFAPIFSCSNSCLRGTACTARTIRAT